ncbi:hypothetical protein GGR56DRAFT_352076 [Xylariaceae sp. FL0804]|nr:hypothetical protein GGR56DRAFT_352076 [Xylariaceae sp. FL0804]
MGKSRRNRAKGGQRSDPIAKPVKPPSDPELAAIREKRILPVLKDLQSSDPKSRTAAAGAVANIVQDTKCRKLLLREQVVPILLNETLSDASLESRAAGWEILKVLVDNEEEDFCVHLHRIDVLTAIQHAGAKVTEALTASSPVFAKRIKAEQSFVWSIAENLAIILSALASAQDVALDSASQNEQIVQFLFTMVASDTTPVTIPASTLWSVLSCMIVFSEDNRQFGEQILAGGQPPCYNQLVAFSGTGGYTAVLSCGILHNVFTAMAWDDQNPGRDGACDAVLVPILSQALEHTGVLANVHNASSPAQILQFEVALEVLASIGTELQGTLARGNKRKGVDHQNLPEKDGDAMDADDDEVLSDEDKPADEDDEMGADEMLADIDVVTGEDHEDSNDTSGLDELPTLKAFLEIAIPEIIKVSQAEIGPDEFSASVRSHAYTALNNVAWTVSCLDFTEKSNAAIQQAWTPVALNIWKRAIAPVLASDTSDIGLATIVTSLAWAVARTLRPEDVLISGHEHGKFISLYQASRNLLLDAEQDDPFQSLGVKCIGILGQFAIGSAPIALNREIGVFLLTVVGSLPDTPAADAVEALNQLFDIYDDEKKACEKEVFWKDNFLKHMEEAVPKVRTMVKQVDKRKSSELRTRAEEANLNLSRFIQYKQKHRP